MGGKSLRRRHFVTLIIVLNEEVADENGLLDCRQADVEAEGVRVVDKVDKLLECEFAKRKTSDPPWQRCVVIRVRESES